MKYPDRNRGFTLIELSVVLIVIALITGMGLVATMGTLESARRAQTENKLDIIEKTLMEFRNRYNRLPCPGEMTLAESSSLYGLEGANPGRCYGGSPSASIAAAVSVDGSSFSIPIWGVLPARTLGLPDEFMYDGWGRRIRYAVDGNVTATNAFNIIPPSATNCRLTVMNPAGGYRSGSASAGGAVYALVSHGANGHGGFTKSGSMVVAGSVNTAENTNCACDEFGNISINTGYTFVQKESTEDPTNVKNSFDDIVRFKERWQLQNEADYANTRGNRRCQMLVGISDASTDREPVNCYRRECGSWGNAYTATTYLNPANSDAHIANIFFAPDNSYAHVTFSRPGGVSCTTPNFGVCGVVLDQPAPSGTTFYCSFSCPDAGVAPAFDLSNNNYYAAANTEGVPLQLFKLSGTTFNQLNTATAIVPPITSYTFQLDSVVFSPNADYMAASDYQNSGTFNIYRRYTPDVFKEIHSSKYPDSLPTGDVIKSVAFSPDGKFFAVADWGANEVLIWQVGEGNPFISGGTDIFTGPIETFTYGGNECYPNTLAFSPDSQYLAVGFGANDCIVSNNIAASVKIYKIDGTTFSEVTIATGAPNVFYSSSGYNVPYKLTFTADSNGLLITTFDDTAGIVTLNRVDATTFEQRIPRVTGGGQLTGVPNTHIRVLH